ncbi:hypothetical protein ONZ45_g7982 [Pleurotus djamor]|nr:hypothetical protein ONZ45_g7982 [Pleurotus djamor]
MMRITPVRKLLRALDIKHTLGKRNHKDSQGDAQDNSESNGRQQTLKTPLQNKTIALQYEDQSEDAIVITTLDGAPFCCHEDLVTMSRPQLLEVANTLNAKLPRTLKVSTDSNQSDRFIRKQIEYAVGITQRAPNAPKSRRTRILDVEETNGDDYTTPFSSPLASRSRVYGAYSPSPLLARLDEADEEEETSSSSRPNKRRKVATEDPAADENFFTSPKLEEGTRKFATAAQLTISPLPAETRGPKTPSARGGLRSRRQNFDLSKSQNKRKHYGRGTPTSSQRFSQNTFLTPVHTSTPRRRGGEYLRNSPYRPFMGNMTSPAADDSMMGGEAILDLYEKMCESYDGDFVDMDFSS